MELFLAGKLQRRLAVATRLARKADRWIGSHPSVCDGFQGDLAELLIFNAALSPDEIERLSGNLLKKYGGDST